MSDGKVKEFPLAKERAGREVPLFMPGSAGNQMAVLVNWLRWVHKMPERRFSDTIGRSRNPFTGGPRGEHARLREACFDVAVWVVDSFGLEEDQVEPLTDEFDMLLGLKPQGFDQKDNWRATALGIQALWKKGVADE